MKTPAAITRGSGRTHTRCAPPGTTTFRPLTTAFDDPPSPFNVRVYVNVNSYHSPAERFRSPVNDADSADLAGSHCRNSILTPRRVDTPGPVARLPSLADLHQHGFPPRTATGSTPIRAEHESDRSVPAVDSRPPVLRSRQAPRTSIFLPADMESPVPSKDEPRSTSVEPNQSSPLKFQCPRRFCPAPLKTTLSGSATVAAARSRGVPVGFDRSGVARRTGGCSPQSRVLIVRSLRHPIAAMIATPIDIEMPFRTDFTLTRMV